MRSVFLRLSVSFAVSAVLGALIGFGLLLTFGMVPLIPLMIISVLPVGLLFALIRVRAHARRFEAPEEKREFTYPTGWLS